jgi:hypothetical protein
MNNQVNDTGSGEPLLYPIEGNDNLCFQISRLIQ